MVFLIIVLLFGAAKLPKLARSMGEAVNEFKDGTKKGETPTVQSEGTEEIDKAE